MAAIVDNTNADFEYPRLNHQREIRLLAVTGTTSDGMMCCALISVRLDKQLRYTALSYVWGSDPARHIIMVQGQKFRVRNSLFEFLTTIAATKLVGIPIFIDAVCINQMDLAERNHQVAQMRQVYLGATQVVAWLGSREKWNSAGSKIAKAFLRPFITSSLAANGGSNVLEQYIRSTDEAAFNLWLAMMSLFWRRLWIVQELVSAKSLIFYHGTATIPHEVVHALGRAVTQTMLPEVDGWDRHSTDYGHAMAHDLLPKRAFARNARVAARILQAPGGSSNAPRAPLYEVLTKWSIQECSEPRDIIYGLLGLAECRVKVEYNISHTQLFLNVLMEGLIDIADATRIDATSQRQVQLQTAFLDACIRGFRLTPAHPTVLFLLLKATIRYGTFNELDMVTTLTPTFRDHSRGKWPKVVQAPILLSFYTTTGLTVLLRGIMLAGVIDQLRVRYTMIQLAIHLAIQESRYGRLKQSNGRMSMPDGETGTYSDWMERIDRTVEFMKGVGPCPKDTRVDRAGDVEQQQRDYERQCRIDILVEVTLAFCVVVLCMLLAGPMRTAGSTVRSAMSMILRGPGALFHIATGKIGGPAAPSTAYREL